MYDKIASIPTMENRERALSFFKKTYSDKFIQKFGDFTKQNGISKGIKEVDDALNTRFTYEAGKNIRFRFIGEKGLQNALRGTSPEQYVTIMQNHAIAVVLHNAGADDRTVFNATGWLLDKDGKWKYEMPDNVRFNEKFLDNAFTMRNNRIHVAEDSPLAMNLTMEDLVGGSGYYNELSNEYPSIKDMKVVVYYNVWKSDYGSYSKKHNTLYLNMYLMARPEDIAVTMIHEIQHFIQDQEGFSGGGSTGSAMVTREYRESAEPVEKKMAEAEGKRNVLLLKRDDYRAAKERFDEINKLMPSMYSHLTERYIELDKKRDKLKEERGILYKRRDEILLKDLLSEEDLREVVSIEEKADKITDEILEIQREIRSSPMYRNSTDAEKLQYREASNALNEAIKKAGEEDSRIKSYNDEINRYTLELESIAFKIYKRIAGEVESRIVELRYLAKTQGLRTFWLDDADVPISERVFMESGENSSLVTSFFEGEDDRSQRFVGRKGIFYMFCSDDPALQEMASKIFDDLEVAERMKVAGKSDIVIAKATGWRLGKDGKWRYELVDTITVKDDFHRAVEAARLSESDISEGGGTKEWDIHDVIPEDSEFYKEMVESYSKFEKIKFVIGKDSNSSSSASYIEEDGKIIIKINAFHYETRERTTASILHEIQHFIQKEEGFAEGGNTEFARKTRHFLNLRRKLNNKTLELSEEIDRFARNHESYVSAMKEFSEFESRFDQDGDIIDDDYLRRRNRYKEISQRQRMLERKLRDEKDESRREDISREIDEISKEIDVLTKGSDVAFFFDEYRKPTEEEKNKRVELRNKVYEAYEKAKKDPRIYKKSEELKEVIKRNRNLEFEVYSHIYGEIESRNTAFRWFAGLQGNRQFIQSEDMNANNAVYVMNGVELSEAELKALQMKELAEVEVVTRDDIEQSVKDQSVKNDMLQSKGWYDVSSDKIYVVSDNNESIADVESTILHEAIAHKGLRNLLGDKFSDVMDVVFSSMSEADRKSYVELYGSPEVAAEEYIARLAENGTDMPLLRRIIAAIRKAFRDLGINLQMTDNDMIYLLHLSRRNLSRVDEKISSSSKENNNPPKGEMYDSGEPRLFFKTSDNRIFDTYGEALENETGTIEAGFITSKLSEDPASEATNINGEMRIASPDSFIPLMRLSAKTDPFNRQGAINYLIKKGYLNSEKIFDRDAKTYRLTGAGRMQVNRLRNSALAYYQLGNMLGFRNVEMDEHGYIRILPMRPGMVTMRDRNGRETSVSREEIKNQLFEGRFNEMNRKYDNFDAMVVSIINEIEAGSTNSSPTARPLSEEESNIKNRIVAMLRSMGIRVMGMSDYLEKYEIKHGVEPSARALADLANGVIAVAEGASIEDVIEEVAHFMVEAYQDQAAVNEALEGIEETAEWNEFASQYYEIYGKEYSGEELENAVRREILGKVLKNRILGRDVNQGNIGFFQRIAALARAIVDWIRSNFTNQRDTLDEIVEDLSNAFAASETSLFDSSLLKKSTYTLYSASQKKESDVFKNSLKRLRESARRIRQLGSMRSNSIEVTLNQLKPIEDQLLQLDNKIDSLSRTAALTAFISSAEAQANYLEKLIENINNPNASQDIQMQPSDRVNIESITNDIMPMLQELRLWLRRDTNDTILNSAQRAGFVRRINDVSARLGDLAADARMEQSTRKEDFLDRKLTDFGVTDPDDRERITTQYNKAQKDVNIFARWFGTLEFCSNIINRMLGRLISDGNKAAMDAYQRVINPLMEQFSRGGWSVSNIDRILQKIDGKPSKYLWSRLNMAQFDFDFKKNQMIVLRELLKNRIDYFKKLTDETIDEKIRRGNFFEFEAEVNGVKRKVRFRPSQDKIIDEFLTVDESLKFRELQGAWIAENTEQKMSDKFYERISKVYTDLEAENKPVSEATKTYLRNMRFEISRLKEKFRDKNGFRWWDYINSAEHGEVQRILKLQREAASKYIYPGDGSRIKKTGEAARIAEDLTNIREYQKKNNVWTDNMANAEFYDQLRTQINRARSGEISYRDVLRFVMETGKMQFSDRFWKSSGVATDENGNSLEDVRLLGIIDNMRKIGYGGVRDAERYYNQIKVARETISEVMRFSRDVNNPGNTDLSLMNSADMNTIRSASRSIEEGYRNFMNEVKQSGIKVEEAEERAPRNYAFNDAFEDAFQDNKEAYQGHRYRFAMSHMTDSKRRMMDNFMSKIGNSNNNFPFNNSETEFLAKTLGINPNLSSSDFIEKVREKINSMNEAEREVLYDGFSSKLVLPYFRRTEPAGYSTFLMLLENGNIDIEQFVRDVQNKNESNSSLYGGLNVLDLSYSANLDFSDMERVSEEDYNPNYRENHGYGRYMPKVSKYEDKEYMNHFGIRFDENGNEVATRDKETHRFIQSLSNVIEENLILYGVNKRKSKFMIPQVSKTKLERFVGLGSHPIRTLQNTVKDRILDRYDDSLYGTTEDNESTDLASRPKIIPRYFITELEDSDDLSFDLAYTISMMTMQANLYKQRSDAMSDALGLQNLLMDMQFSKGQKADSTNAMAMFNEWMNANFYGIHSNTDRITWNILGYPVDMTKIFMGLERFMSTMNLALSPFVAATGAITGQINYLIEGAVGQYLTPESIMHGYVRANQEMPSYVLDIGRYDKESNLAILGENMGVLSFRDRMYGAGFNRAARVLTRGLLFKPMEILNSPLGPQVMYAVMDSYRRYEGEYYSFRQFELMMRKKGIKDVKGEWKKLREYSLDNLTTVKNKQVQPKENLQGEELRKYEEAMTRARNQIKSLAQIVNGSLNEENRTSATRNALLRFTTAHRGWLVIAAQRLYSRANYNFQTNQYEEGLMTSIGQLIKSFYNQFSEKGIRDFVQAYEGMKSEMTDYQRMNMKRVAVYLAMFALLNLLSAFIFGWRDDDEDDEEWMTQFGTYIGMRVINEIASQIPGIFEHNMIDVINDPFVIGRKLADLANFNNWSGDLVSSGTYEGETKRWRMFSKMTFLKQWYNVSTPKAIARSADWWLQTNQPSMMFFWGAERSRKDEIEREAFD